MGDARDARFGWRTYKEVAEADVTTPGTDGHAVFWDTVDSLLKVKHDDGSVEEVAAGPLHDHDLLYSLLTHEHDADYAPADFAGQESAIAVCFPEPAADDQYALVVPFDCTIVKADCIGDVTDSISIDVWKDTRANHPPTVADSIVASAPIALVSQSSSEDATLTGWTTTLTKGDVLIFNVNSAGAFGWVTAQLQVEKA